MLEWHSANLPNLRRAYREAPFVTSLSRKPDPIDEFRGALHWLLGLFRQRGISAVVLGQPVLWKPEFTADEYNSLWFSINTPDGPVRPSGSWLLSEMRKYNDVQREEAEHAGFAFVDLDGELQKSLTYYFDDCHFTDKGSVRVAEIVLPALKTALDARRVNP